jgi:DNA-binding XRE family transcriptional regulator
MTPEKQFGRNVAGARGADNKVQGGDPLMPTEHDAQVAVAFGRNLRAARKKAGIGQHGLARAAGLHRTTMGFLENGERTPRIDTLLLLADALDIDPCDLLKGVKVSPRPTTGPLP